MKARILSQGEEYMKKIKHVLVLSLFIVSVLLFSPVALSDVETTAVISNDDSLVIASDYVPRDIRVAIYDEPNFTAPEYASMPGAVNNNATGLMDILVGYGYDVTIMDVQDISNRELTTANYDVFCLVDNFPRENITYHIMDFWLGGGGLLVFDGSAGFLSSFGILPPEALGTSGFPTYWQYTGDNFHFVGLHPVTKSVTHPYTILTGSGGLNWNFPILQSTSIGGDVTKLATSGVSPDWATMLAFDPSDRGGRVVTIAHDLEWEQLPDLYPIYNDAVDWLAPRPKARVLYDLTHQPWVPTDTWEWAGDANYLTTWRDGLVSRSFTVDKIHPSVTGNLTTENLAPYDMLVTNQPLLSFSSQEILDVEAWVQAGGGLFVIGDNPGVPDNYHLDDLIAPYGMQFNDTVSPYDQAVTVLDMHPTTDECFLNLAYHGSTNLILSGGAYPIWSYAPGEVAAAASEYGEGRVVVICDANSIADTWIIEVSNYQFAINVANWLTSSNATVLLYHDSTGVPLYNFYRSAVADALNELGINFILTRTPEYFNLSMKLQEWDFVISDANSRSPVTFYYLLRDHLANGGKLIMRDFFFRFPAELYPQYDFSLFDYIGFEGAGTDARITDAPPTVYMWDEFHDIFDRPVEFAVDRFETTSNYYFTDWTNVTLFGNATALAGITPSPQLNQSAIVLGGEGRALCNMFSISQYDNDYDNSTYADNFELWLNEIAYMMRPTIDSPGDLSFEVGSGEVIWTAHSYAPGDYQIKRDAVLVATQVWDGSAISIDVSGLSVGVYEFELTVRDHVGYRADDTISVTIEEAPTPTTTTTSGPPPGPVDMTTLILIIAGVGVVIVVVLIIFMKKKK
jgi:hypothetical protein